MHPNVHSNIIYNSQNREQPKRPSVDEWIKKIGFICYIYIYIYNGILAIKRMNFCHLQQHGWTCRVLFLVK